MTRGAFKSETYHYSVTNEEIVPPIVTHDPSRIGTYVAHASLRPRAPRALTSEELSQYPQLPQELQDLLVSSDSNAESVNNPLDELMKLAPQWADEGMSQEDIVKQIQAHCNVTFDAPGIMAAYGMAREAVMRANGEVIFTTQSKELEAIGVTFRDDTPSVVKLLSSDGESRHQLLTPEARKRFGITTMTILEKDFIAKQAELAKLDVGKVQSPSRVQTHSESDEENMIKGENDE